MKRLSLLLFLVLASPVSSATYYADHTSGVDTNNGTATGTPFAHAPGMPDCSDACATAYAALTGDDLVVLKGGETWTASGAQVNVLVIKSGSAGHPITYQGGQLLGTPWGTGYPILDGNNQAEGMAHPSGSGTKTDYITIDGIKVINTAERNCIQFYTDYGGLEVKNSWLEGGGSNGIAVIVMNNANSVLIHNNRIKNNANQLFSNVTSGYTLDNFQIYDNIIEGCDDTIDLGPLHPDGLQMTGYTETPWAMTNLKIYNNLFRGNWYSGGTGMIYLQWANGVEIYNNLFAFENTTGVFDPVYSFSPGIIVIGGVATQHNDNIKIYNNTITSVANYGYNLGARDCISISANQGTIDIRNNIISLCEFGIDIVTLTGNTITSDYNLFQRRDGGHVVALGTTYHADTVGTGSTPCTTNSWDCNSLSGDPSFVTLPTGSYGSGDFSLQAGSPAINKGADTSDTIGTTDITGATRIDTYDIGAYEYGAGGEDPDLPTLTSSTISSDGRTISLLFSEVMTHNTETGWAITMTGGAVTMTYKSGSGGDTLVYNLSRRIKVGSTGTVAWTAEANTIEDTSGNDLATIVSAAVTNSSTLNAPDATLGVGPVGTLGVGPVMTLY